MTSSEVAALVAHEIASFEYAPGTEWTFGKPWDEERVEGEVKLLRDSLVLPSQRTLHIHERPDETVWLIALIDNVALYLDEQRAEFGLGELRSDQSIGDWGVYGDLIGTFMAR